jgi:hypothetical protein
MKLIEEKYRSGYTCFLLPKANGGRTAVASSYGDANAYLVRTLIKLSVKIGEPVETSIGTFSPDDLPDVSRAKIQQYYRGPESCTVTTAPSKSGRYTWEQTTHCGSSRHDFAGGGVGDWRIKAM